MQRYALRDDQWTKIRDFLPRAAKATWAARRPTIVCLSMPSFIATAQASPGATCRRDTGLGSQPTSVYRRWCESGVFARILGGFGIGGRRGIHVDQLDQRSRPPT